jgi:hypothetical protein
VPVRRRVERPRVLHLWCVMSSRAA